MGQRFDDHDVAVRFLTSRMTEFEEQAFLRRLRSNPQTLDELAAVADFRLGLAALRDSSELASLLKPRSRISRSTRLALAAAVMIAVTSAVSLRLLHPRPMLAANATMLDEAGVTLPRTGIYPILRSRDHSDTSIRLPSRPGCIELRVLPEIAATSYRITLTAIDEDDDGHELATLAQLQPREDGFIQVYLASAALKPGLYRLTVGGVAASGVVESASMFMVRATAEK